MSASKLGEVKTGRIERPHFVLVYGVDKVGKSTFAAEAPKTIFLGNEKGTSSLSVARYPAINSYEDLSSAIVDLLENKHDYKTVAVDSLDWIEPLVWDYVCRSESKGGQSYDSIEDFGYGKGYVKALEAWRFLLKGMQALVDSGVNVILIAHAEVKTFNDPQENAAYDRYQLKLHNKAAGLFREAVDTIIFANFDVSTTKEKGARKAMAFGDGNRIGYTERRPAFDAGNRDGLPSEIEFSWASYEKARKEKLGETPDQVLKSIQGLVKNLKDQDVINQVNATIKRIADEGNDLLRLNKLKAKLVTIATVS